MIRIILHGCNGHMGRVLTGIIEKDPDLTVAAGVDPFAGAENTYPVYPNIDEVKEEADCVIDFSTASAVDGLLDYCERKTVPLVLCTTGLSDAQLKRAGEVARKTAVLRSANMSLGINTIIDLLKKATQVFAPAGFDVEIVEKHHNQKVDAPSGTAIALADAVNEAGGGTYTYVYDRHDRRQKRDPKEIGISSVRGGTIVGDHEVIFAGLDEVVTFKHTAYSKSVFANGAAAAAKFLAGKPAGMYDMADVIAARNEE